MMITILSVEMLEVNSPGSFTIGSVLDYHTVCICASGPILYLIFVYKSLSPLYPYCIWMVLKFIPICKFIMNLA